MLLTCELGSGAQFGAGERLTSNESRMTMDTTVSEL